MTEEKEEEYFGIFDVGSVAPLKADGSFTENKQLGVLIASKKESENIDKYGDL